MKPRGFRWEWEKRLRDSPLESGPKLVGLTMATFGDVDGREIYPSTDRLAAACGMNPQTVRKHRETLIDAGAIEAIHSSGGRGKANEYRLVLPESLPTGRRVKRSVTPPKPTKQPKGIAPETLRFDAPKPSGLTDANPTNGSETTRTDQTRDQVRPVVAFDQDGWSVPGSELVAKPIPNRHSADARACDDFGLEATS